MEPLKWQNMIESSPSLTSTLVGDVRTVRDSVEISIGITINIDIRRMNVNMNKTASEIKY